MRREPVWSPRACSQTSMLHLLLVIRCSAAAAVAEAEGIPLSPVRLVSDLRVAAWTLER